MLKAGRPKRVFSDEEVALIKDYAHNNCLTNTIAVALNIPLMTLKRHFGKKLTTWRAQGKIELRQNQRNLSKISATMAQFLGKNELDQTDKQIIVDETQVRELSESEQAEARRLADLRLRKGA